MDKGGKKYCSILNYVKAKNKVLYEVVQDLCLNRMFTPRRDAGLTFLMPDKDLTKQLKKMADGADAEEAVKHLQSMMLLDHVKSLAMLSPDAVIATYLHRKLPVKSNAKGQVELSNGAVVKDDNGFVARGDRSNLAVYQLSKKLPPTDTEKVNLAEVKPMAEREIEGGAQFGEDKKLLFQDVVAQHDNRDTMKKRDPAMEVLVSLCRHLKNREQQAKYDLVCSQLSCDTLASLAIVLQPYRTKACYLDGTDWKDWVNDPATGNGADTAEFVMCQDPVGEYRAHMAHGAQLANVGALRGKLEHLADVVSRPTIMSKIHAMLSNSVGDVQNPARKNVLADDKALALAEAELRVFSALACDNDASRTDLMVDKCKLDEPYLVSDKVAKNSDLGFYYSSVYLMARSDALAYHPGVAGGEWTGLDKIADDGNMVKLDHNMYAPDSVKEYYDKQFEAIKRAYDAINKKQEE